MGEEQILIIDSGSESLQNIRFLLHLGGYRTTAVRDGIEAINWVLSRRRASDPFALLLFNEELGEEVGKVALALRSLKSSLPLLAVYRGGEGERGASPAAKASDKGVRYCPPDALLETVRSMTAEEGERHAGGRDKRYFRLSCP